MAIVVHGLGGEGEGQRERGKGLPENSLARPSLPSSALSSANSLLSRVLGFRFTKVTFLLTLPSLQSATEAESNGPVKSLGQRKTGWLWGGLWEDSVLSGGDGILRGEMSQKLRFVSHIEMLLKVMGNFER